MAAMQETQYATAAKPTSVASASSMMYDTVCVGFGPAALALAIAMRDRNLQQRTLFLEQESQFTWTSGSADAASEISLIKDDLATMRNPRSAFTFLNYLQVTGRLQEVLSKLGSASLQQDYNDYMAWCAAQFEDWVEYGQQIMGVESVQAQPGWPVEYFQVTARDTRTGEVSQMLAKNIIIANTKEAMPTFLRPLSSILDGSSVSGQIADRNNRLRFSQGKVARTSGVWMQSSAKRGHENLDAPFSILAVRAGEIVESLVANNKRSEQFATL